MRRINITGLVCFLSRLTPLAVYDAEPIYVTTNLEQTTIRLILK